MAASDSIQFVFTPDEVDFSTGRLRARAFVPRKENGQLKLSTCEDRNLGDGEVWALGERLRAFKQSRKKGPGQVTLHGRADMKAQSYSSRGLDFVAAPFLAVPEHTNVVGWEQAALDSETHHEQLALNISFESLFIPRP